MIGHLGLQFIAKDQRKPEPSTGEVYVSKAQLAAIWECSADLIHDYEIDEMNSCLAKYEITTAPRIRHFLSQTAHESGGGRYKKELPVAKRIIIVLT